MDLKPDGYATLSAQQGAIAAWRAKHDVHATRVKKLDSKIGAQKKSTALDAKKRQWKNDRDNLHREQDKHEDDLRSLYTSCLDSEMRAYLMSLETARIQFAVDLSDDLRTAQNDVRCASTSESRTAATRDLKQRLQDEAAELDKRFSHSDEQLDESRALGGTPAAGLEDVFEEFEGRFASLACSSLNSGHDDLRDTLSSALSFAREKAIERAGRPPTNARSSAGPDVMATVSLLLKMAERGRHTNLQSATTANMIERVRSSCPQLTQQEAKAALEDAMEKRNYVQSCRAAAVDYRKAAQSILSLFAATASANARVEAMTQEKDCIAAADEKRQEVLHAKAEEQRQLYTAKVEAQAAQARADQAKEGAELAKRKEQQMRELQVRLDCLASYLQKRSDLAAEEARQAALQQQIDEAERQVRQRHNGQRVAYRKEEYEERQESKRQQALEVERLRAEKQAALERFFRAVDDRIGVEANPERILLATVASSQVSKEPQSSVAGQFRVANGYSDEQIMKDPRVKLYSALMEAGLHKTEYGREVATRGFRVSPAQQASEMNPLRGGGAL